MEIWLQTITLIAVLVLLAVVLLKMRHEDLAESTEAFKDAPAALKVLDRLETAAEEGRLSNDLLAVAVKHIGEHASDVATDLRESHDRADKANSKLPGAAADAAAQLTVKEKAKIKPRKKKTI